MNGKTISARLKVTLIIGGCRQSASAWVVVDDTLPHAWNVDMITHIQIKSQLSFVCFLHRFLLFHLLARVFFPWMDSDPSDKDKVFNSNQFPIGCSLIRAPNIKPETEWSFFETKRKNKRTNVYQMGHSIVEHQRTVTSLILIRE